MNLTPRELNNLLRSSRRNDNCWKGYVQAGMKRKRGKEVPNCVPASSGLSKPKAKKDTEMNASTQAALKQLQGSDKGATLYNTFNAGYAPTSIGELPSRPVTVGPSLTSGTRVYTGSGVMLSGPRRTVDCECGACQAKPKRRS